MGVVNSSFAPGHAQLDGRRYVVEQHTLDSGEVIVREYGPVETIDYAQVAAEMAAQIEADMAAQAETVAQEALVADAQEKVAAVLEAALGKGEISEQELKLAGLELAEVKGG